MTRPQTPFSLIFDLDGVLMDTLPFFNVICAVMINDALRHMTGQRDRDFTSFEEIYGAPEIIGSIYPEKLEWVIKQRGLQGLDRNHPVARESYEHMRNIADEMIGERRALVQQRPQGALILAELESKRLLDSRSGEARLEPFQRVPECLQALSDAGALMGVASTNHQARTEGLLKIGGLDRFFHSVTGTSLSDVPVEHRLQSKSADTPDVYLAQHAKMTGHPNWKDLRKTDLSHVTAIEDSPKGGEAVIGANMTLVGICHDGDKFAAEEQSLSAIGARVVVPDFATLTGYLLHNRVR